MNFELMVAMLKSLSDNRRDVIPSQADMTAFTETHLLKGYQITGKKQYFAKNLEPVNVL